MKTVKLSEIYPNKSNPRRIDKRKVELLIKSLKEFPQMLDLRPIVINKEGMILGGNMRYHALKAMGIKEVSVEVADGLTYEQEREFVLKDNTNFGEWDFDLLANEWGDLPLYEWGIDIDIGKSIEYEPENKETEVDELETENECPKCGYKW